MSESSDPYLYPGTDVLRNIPGIRKGKDLITFETLNSGARMYELRLQPTAGVFDVGHLKAIHKYIFQDVYLWAGQFRTTLLGKAQFASPLGAGNHQGRGAVVAMRSTSIASVFMNGGFPVSARKMTAAKE